MVIIIKNISYKRGPRHPSCNWAPQFLGPALGRVIQGTSAMLSGVLYVIPLLSFKDELGSSIVQHLDLDTSKDVHFLNINRQAIVFVMSGCHI